MYFPSNFVKCKYEINKKSLEDVSEYMVNFSDTNSICNFYFYVGFSPFYNSLCFLLNLPGWKKNNIEYQDSLYVDYSFHLNI